MKNVLLYILCFVTFCLTSCKSGHVRYGLDGKKAKYLWICAEANIERLSSRDSIVYYLDKIKATGFNNIVVDVKPIEGFALYKNTMFDKTIILRGDTINLKFDYLQCMIEEAHKRNLGVMVSAVVFPIGEQHYKEGPAYTNPLLKGRTCIEYTPDGFKDIKDDTTKVGVFFNPALPENRQYALDFIRELFENYDFEGFSLDYCRYPGLMSDFSNFSKVDFENYLGSTIENWPIDIFAYNEEGERVPGKYYKEWIAYRAKVIHDMIVDIRTMTKSIKPDVEIDYWAASWIYGLYENGQNWASKNFDMTSLKNNESWASKAYNDYGFADQLDAFMLGAYLPYVYGVDNEESIEYAINRAKKVLMNDCKLYGTFYAKNHGNQTADATYMCLHNTDGLMVFDITHLINKDLWDDVKEGIERAEKEYKLNSK